MTLDTGQPAPDFTLTAHDGSDVSLKKFAGKKLVLYFYPRDDTPGCTTEAKDFTALADAFADANTVVIGVSKDSVASHVKFIDKHELRVTLLADEETELCQRYGVWVEKSMYGKKYMGIERATFLIGENGTIQQIWRKVKVNDHAKQVLDVATSL